MDLGQIFVTVFIVSILVMIASHIYYEYNQQFRAVLYGNGNYRIEKRTTFFTWHDYIYNSYPSETEAMDRIRKLYQEIEDEEIAKKRIKVIKYEMDYHEILKLSDLQTKLSALVRAVNEGRKEDEEKIFSEISRHFDEK